jgi:hypothetical protein
MIMEFGNRRCGLPCVAAAVLAVGCAAAVGQEVRVEALSFPKLATEKVELLISPRKTVEVTLQSHALADPLMVPRLPVWKFGKSVVDAEGKMSFKTFGRVKPGGSKRQLLVFIRKGQALEDGFQVISLDGSKAGFGDGKMFIMNLAQREVAGQVGGKRFVLAPGRHVVVKPAADRGEDLCYAVLRYQREEKWRTFFSTNWPMLENARGLVFTYEDGRSKSLRMHSVVDSLFEVPEPES